MQQAHSLGNGKIRNITAYRYSMYTPIAYGMAWHGIHISSLCGAQWVNEKGNKRGWKSEGCENIWCTCNLVQKEEDLVFPLGVICCSEVWEISFVCFDNGGIKSRHTWVWVTIECMRRYKDNWRRLCILYGRRC